MSILLDRLKPYAILAAILGIFALCVACYWKGSEHGSGVVQAAWDKATIVAQDARAKRIAQANQVTAALQAKADKEREDERKAAAARERQLRADLASLRNRPERPAGGLPEAPRPGPAPACTGAGLYRDDAEFLVWFAAEAQAVREQRDQYWRLYEEARGKLESLRSQK